MMSKSHVLNFSWWVCRVKNKKNRTFWSYWFEKKIDYKMRSGDVLNKDKWSKEKQKVEMNYIWEEKEKAIYTGM
jgi:hypothetical protein